MAAEALVFSHFGQFVGSPSFPGWLKNGLKDAFKRSIGDHSNFCTDIDNDEPLLAGPPLLLESLLAESPEISETSIR
jgi:hypothetical protein